MNVLLYGKEKLESIEAFPLQFFNGKSSLAMKVETGNNQKEQ